MPLLPVNGKSYHGVAGFSLLLFKRRMTRYLGSFLSPLSPTRRESEMYVSNPTRLAS